MVIFGFARLIGEGLVHEKTQRALHHYLLGIDLLLH